MRRRRGCQLKTLGALTTFHYEHPTQLHLLRLFVDSLRLHAPDLLPFLLVDDCSQVDPAYDAYLSHLVTAGWAIVYRLGPPRPPFHGPGRRGGATPADASYGHAVGLMAGFHRLRALGRTHAWVLDADCALLDGGWRAAWRLTAIGAVVTDYFGGRPAPGVTQVCGERWCYRSSDSPEGRDKDEKALQPHRAALFLHGFPNLFCAIVDLRIEERFGALANAGWVNSRWGYRLFRAGYVVAYFPFFQGRHVYHHGFGMSKYNAQLVGQTFGNALETAAYGGKAQGVYHAGYLQLTRSTEAHAAWLAETYAGRPAGADPVALDRGWLGDPPATPVHGREPQFLRPFAAGDFDALREIDSDPEATRYFSWGPHGPEQTRTFLTRASAEPRRWLVLADGVSPDTLLGYGEIRPLSDPLIFTDPPYRGAGLTYVIARRHWGRGYGRVLLNALVETGFSQQGYDQFVVAVDVEHAASRRTLEQSGRQWVLLRTEPYLLKGAARERCVYRHLAGSVRPPEPPADPEACHRARERLLFEELGVWR